MGMQKLSKTIQKKAATSVMQIIIALCIMMGIITTVIITINYHNLNTSNVKYYTSEIDRSISEKMSFIDTVASGVSSGSVSDDYYSYVDTMVALHNDVSAVYVCVAEPDVVYSDGIMTYMSGGWVPPEAFVVSERSWYVGAKEREGVFVSEPYVDEQTGNICITLSKAIYKNDKFIGVAGLDMYMDDLVSLMEGSYNKKNYVFLVTEAGTILTHPNEDLALSTENSVNIFEDDNDDEGVKTGRKYKRYKKICENLLKNRYFLDFKGGTKIGVGNVSDVTGWYVIAVYSNSWINYVIIGMIVAGGILGVFFTELAKYRLRKAIDPMFVPLEDISANVSKITDGELGYNFTIDNHSKEVNELSNALNTTMRDLESYINEITEAVTSISEKDLSFEVKGSYVGDYEQIKTALTNIMQVLNDNFTEINNQAATVLEYSQSLSQTSESVAETATNQSQAVLDASNEMKNLTEDMERISEFAYGIRNNANETNERLTAGSQEMVELVEAMNEIADCYAEIAGFVDEINNIASQTNLLSLNASIEAARAGEVGRGFAVVAGEISSLSDSSSSASTKISEAISRAESAVEKGRKLVGRTEQTIVDGVNKAVENGKMVNEIVGFVETQKTSASEISASLHDISELVEGNAANAEENSAISVQLGECAKSLMGTIAEFKLK